MISYEFYRDVYLGYAIPEVAFPQTIARAEQWLQKLERTCYVAPHGPDSRAMAVCAVAETMEVFRKRQNIAQASVGGVSVRYAHSDRKLERQLYQNAQTFLDIRRGVC